MAGYNKTGPVLCGDVLSPSAQLAFECSDHCDVFSPEKSPLKSPSSTLVLQPSAAKKKVGGEKPTNEMDTGTNPMPALPFSSQAAQKTQGNLELFWPLSDTKHLDFFHHLLPSFCFISFQFSP